MNENTTTNSSDEVVVHATEDRWEADIFRLHFATNVRIQ